MNWWETEFLAVKDNKLWIAGQSAESLAERYGKVKTIVGTQLASLPFMVYLGFAGYLPLAVAAFVMRAALMNMSGPIANALILFRQGAN